MKKLIACAALIALAACGSETPEPAPTPTVSAAPTVAATPSLSPPGETEFAAAYAEGCPAAKPVSTSLCKSQGLGTTGFICEYGLGDDEYRRHTATLVPGEGKWALEVTENTCVANDAG